MVFTLLKAQVGTSTLVLAILYVKAGIVSSVLIALVIACISTKTCQILIEHNKVEEVYQLIHTA
jgi:amino acid permease